MTINVKKTKILIANSDGESVSEPLVIRGKQLERVKEFVYLGSTLTEKVGSVTEMVQIYRATVLSTVLFGTDSWTFTDKEYSRLNTFNTKLL